MEEMVEFLSEVYGSSGGDDTKKSIDSKDINNKDINSKDTDSKDNKGTPHAIQYTPHHHQLDILSFSPMKLARLLTSLDIHFILLINPKELVEYDGRDNPSHPNISLLRRKNTGLTNYFSLLMSPSTHGYFLRVMRHLKALRNLNALEYLSKAFKTQRLKKKDLERLSRVEEDIHSYFSLRGRVDGYSQEGIPFIYPFDLFLKDVEDSNLNINSEDASMRFCHLMEMLVILQNNIQDKKNIKKKYLDFFCNMIEEFQDYRSKASSYTTPQSQGIFLLL